MFIYKFTNPNNGESYIGKWAGPIRTLYTRYRRAIEGSGTTRYIINSLRKHGLENYKFEIIKDGIETVPELSKLEIHFIARYNTYQSIGYNMTPGGDGTQLFGERNGMYGKGYLLKGIKRTELVKERMSQYQQQYAPWKGKKLSPEHRLHISQGNTRPMLGKHHTESAKKIQKEAALEQGRQKRKNFLQLYENEIIFMYVTGASLQTIAAKIGTQYGHIGHIIDVMIAHGNLVRRCRNTIIEENYEQLQYPLLRHY